MRTKTGSSAKEGLALQPGPRPFISFCMAGRDDGYTPDFRYRLKTTLEFLAAAIEGAGCQGEVDVVIADWGGEIPLSKCVHLNASACKIVRFVRISRKQMLEMQDGSDHFSTAQAFNVSLRRATGVYKILCGTDILIPSHSLANIFRALKSEKLVNGVRPDKALSMCSRKKIPWDVVRHQPSAAEWMEFIAENEWMLKKDLFIDYGFFGGLSLFGMHSSLWDEFRGIREDMRHWGWHDVELALRVSNIYPWIELSGFGVEIYDLGHQPGGDKRTESIKAPNKWDISPTGHVNPEDWGMGDKVFDIVRPSPSKDKPLKAEPVDADGLLKGAASHVGRLFTSMLDSAAWQGKPFLDKDEICASILLAAVAKLARHNRFVDVGASMGCPAAALLSVNHWMHYLAVDAWLGVCDPSGPHNVGDMLCSHVVGHKGHASFITDPQSFSAFLKNSGYPSLDIVLFRDGVFRDRAAAMKALRKSAAELSPAGLLLYKGSSDFPARKILSSAGLQVSSIPGFDVIIAYRSKALYGGFAKSRLLKPLASSVLESLPMHVYRKVWRSLKGPAAFGKAGRCILFPCGKYAVKVLSQIKPWLDEGPEVVAVLDENPSSGGMLLGSLPLKKPKSIKPRSFDSVVFLSTNSVHERLREKCCQLFGAGRPVFDFHQIWGELYEIWRERKFPDAFYKRVAEAAPKGPLSICGYGINGRHLLRYLNAEGLLAGSPGPVSVWDDFVPKEKLEASGLVPFSPEDLDLWPSSGLIALTPYDNSAMLDRLASLLLRHMAVRRKRRLVLGGLGRNGIRLLGVLSKRKEFSRKRFELRGWDDGPCDAAKSIKGWSPWSPSPASCRDSDTLVLLTPLDSSAMRRRLEKAGAKPFDFFIDNLIWCCV